MERYFGEGSYISVNIQSISSDALTGVITKKMLRLFPKIPFSLEDNDLTTNLGAKSS